jgi:extracellular factor (EF) 3-hydroxypalmitic acid methyl ester biosynthesis protein
MNPLKARLPQAFLNGLTDLQDLLRRIELSSAEAPVPQEASALTHHFTNLWKATGMDTTMCLARATPDHKLFRSAVGQYLWQSTLVRRCFEKPRGYAGDYLMMDAACNEPPPATTRMGQWLNKWFYDCFPPSLAARNRRDMMARLLVDEGKRGARRILNVACGGVPELVQICSTTHFEDVVLLDQDQEALTFATASLSQAKPDLGASTRLTTINMPVQAIVRSPSVIGEAKFDVIYSMGLYDYLAEDRARKLTATLWDSVAPGGVLAIANFQGHDWPRYVLEAAMDWFLVYRDDDELAGLAELPSLERHEVAVDSTGLILMLIARKQS